MKSEILSFGGWRRNLRLFNDSAELIITLDVGPRIISYRAGDGESILGTLSEQMGGVGETECLIRGGHRLWIAPEIPEITCDKDNFPVDYEETQEGHCFSSRQRKPVAVKKTLVVRLNPNDSGTTIEHRLTNEGDEPVPLSSWGLTIMAAGGSAIIPQPPLIPHPEGLLPNRGMILWPYTDLSDPRWTLGRDFFMLRQSSDGSPTKMGLTHREGWVAYLLDDQLFIKGLPCVQGGQYPDGGCNFETFTDARILEIESLSPLAEVEPGESIGHTEQWFLFDHIDPAEITSEEALAEWITPFVRHALGQA